MTQIPYTDKEREGLLLLLRLTRITAPGTAGAFQAAMIADEIEVEANADPYPSKTCAVCVTQGKAWCSRHKDEATQPEQPSPGAHAEWTKHCVICKQPFSADNPCWNDDGVWPIGETWEAAEHRNGRCQKCSESGSPGAQPTAQDQARAREIAMPLRLEVVQEIADDVERRIAAAMLDSRLRERREAAQRVIDKLEAQREQHADLEATGNAQLVAAHGPAEAVLRDAIAEIKRAEGLE